MQHAEIPVVVVREALAAVHGRVRSDRVVIGRAEHRQQLPHTLERDVLALRHGRQRLLKRKDVTMQFLHSERSQDEIGNSNSSR